MAKTNRFRIRHAVTGILTALLLQAGMTLPVFAQEVHRFDIDTTDAATAIHQFGNQSGVQILASAEALNGKHLNRISGDLSTDDGFQKLLAGTGLEHRYVGDRAVALVSETPDPGTAKEPNQKGFWSRFRLAQAEPASKSDTQASPEEQKTSENSSESSQKRIELEEVVDIGEVVVTGTNIRGVKEVAVPSVTITREQIEKTGYATLDDVMEGLPQNFTGVGVDGARPNSGGSILSFGNFADHAAAVDLRGLGAESTLTLLNGTRRANSVNGQVVDVSAIPLSVIERVEVVTGGQSAVYGSDAVGGVVNFVTRRDFEGMETQAHYGWSDEGGEQLQFSTIGGMSFERGSFVGAYDYLRSWPLDLIDTGLVISPTPIVGWIPLKDDLIPYARRHSGFLSGRYSISERIELHGDGLYTARENSASSAVLRVPAVNVSETTTSQDSNQYSASVGARATLAPDWTADLTAAIGVGDFDTLSEGMTDFGGGLTPLSATVDMKHEFSSLSAVVSGALPSWGTVKPRVALGLETREEGFERHQVNNGAVFAIQSRDLDRRVNSAFAELNLPLVADGTRAGLHRLQLSVAGRYDDYSDFGSDLTPQAGLIWELAPGFKLRGSYAQAFRAPSLTQLANGAFVQIRNLSDPSVPGGVTTIAVALGDSRVDLGPEKAETWSAGIDWQPESASWFKGSLSYFDVSYQDRITRPMLGADFINMFRLEDRFAEVITRNPTSQQVAAILALDFDGILTNLTGVPFDPATQDALTVFPGLVAVDNRVNNVAVETLHGLDLQIDTNFVTGAGTFSLGLNGSYILDHDRNVTASSPGVEVINEVGKPVDLRLRATFGWSRGAFGTYAYLNYTDGYGNPFSTPLPTGIDGWTTLDWTLRFDGAQLASTGWISTIEITLGVNNVLDTDPPEFNDDFLGVRYDSANASPYGRQFSLRLVKNW